MRAAFTAVVAWTIPQSFNQHPHHPLPNKEHVQCSATPPLAHNHPPLIIKLGLQSMQQHMQLLIIGTGWANWCARAPLGQTRGHALGRHTSFGCSVGALHVRGPSALSSGCLWQWGRAGGPHLAFFGLAAVGQGRRPAPGFFGACSSGAGPKARTWPACQGFPDHQTWNN